MFKKIKNARFGNFLREVLIALLIGAVIIFVFNLRVKYAEAEFDRYRRAEFCQIGPECRQTMDAVVINSKTGTYSFSVPSGRNSSRKIASNIYLVRLKPEAKESVEVEILPTIFDSTMDMNGVDAVSSYPWFGRENRFAENSFPVDSSIKIETWKGKITFLFSTHINYADPESGAYVYVIPEQPGNNLNGSQTAIGPSSQMIYDEVAVPTVDNPFIHYESAKKDYNNSIIGVIFFCMFLLMIKYLSSLK